MDIGSWLQNLGLERYKQAFRDNEIDTETLPKLTAQDLIDIGVTAVGHRRKLLEAIAALNDSVLELENIEKGSQHFVSAAKSTDPERRHLTVMFCDLVGSTALSERLDPEDLRGVMRAYQDCCAAVLGRWDGHIAKFMGDGVIAYFGHPSVREDDAERAIRAGLELVAAVARIEVGTPLAARVGIATGLVVVGDLIGEGASQEEAVVGETPNLAARLEAIAEAGTVAIAPATRRLVGDLFELRDLGAHALKGFSEPIQVWQPLGSGQARSRFEALRGGRLTPLIGRDRELETLRRALAQAAVGNGQIVAAVGEPGVGKSRLLDAFLASDATLSWRTLGCGCRPYGTSTPWLPVIELIKRLFAIEDREGQASAGDKIAARLATFDNALRPAHSALLALLGLTVEDQAWQALNPPQRRRRILDGVKGLLQFESTHQPLILLIEDLHWADGESVALFDTMIEMLPTSRILLLVSYRPEFRHCWGGRSCYRQLRIDSLATASAEQLLVAMLGDDLSLADLERHLITRTHGNPLFLEEAVRDLVETGVLAGERGAYRLAGDAKIRLSGTVQSILAARIDRLPPEAKQLLQRAAVIGQEVPLAILEKVADRSVEEIRARLAELQAAEMLYEAQLLPDTVYVFKHALTHEVASSSLLRETRRNLHRRVGEALEATYPDRLAELAEALTDHFERGLAWPQAARYALDAAEKAKSRYAYPVGMQYATRAREAASNDDRLTQELIWANVAIGDLASLIDDLDLANQSYDGALTKSKDATEQRWINNKRHDLRHATRDGAKIAYYVHGSGDETILFVTPSGYGLATWQPIVERLCQEFRIITVDLRGTGRSDPLVCPYTERNHASDIAAVVNAASQHAVIGVGVSAAPYFLARAAVTVPGLFKKLVLVGGDPGSDSYPEDAFFPDVKAIEEALARDDLEQVARIFVPNIISEPGTEELIEQRIRAYINLPKETILNFFSVPYPTTAEFGPLLKKLQMPTLVMHGTADKITPIALGRQLADTIPDARIYVFEDRCHLPMITATQEFCDVLREFVRTGRSVRPAYV